MSEKRITEKNLKQHIECSCGLNSVEDKKIFISHAEARLLKMKLRTYKNTGEKFYFIHYKTICERCEEMEERILDFTID